MMCPSALLLLLLGLVSVNASTKLCVPNLGCMQGTLMPGYQKEKFEAFMGIPFAEPPVGDLRFANPKPVQAWSDVLNATSPRADCIQKNYLLPQPFVSGEEDCLYLNVYRPIRRDNNELPVMVYIFGGGFFSGTASPLVHGPEYFMDTKEVILVTIAYRLGALGFLSTGDDNMPGNFGFKDQNLALKWVQKYISAFGGDSKSVTIFGQSAGAASVHLHILSDLSTGLFQRAIVISGNAGAPYCIPIPDPLDQARKQAEYCKINNASTLSTKKLTKALRQIDAKQLVESGDDFKYWHVDPLTIFRPVIEAPSEDAFLTADPRELIASGKYTRTPWMTGMVPGEGAVRALSIVSNEGLRTHFNSRFDDLFGRLMEFPSNIDVEKTIKELVDVYFGKDKELNNITTQSFVDVITDRAFVHPFYTNIKEYLKSPDLDKNPVYLYKFNYRGPFSYSALYTGNFNNYGIVHCDDLIYLFRSPLLFNEDFDKLSVEANMIKELVGTYVSFAKTGKPKGIKACTKESLQPNKICDYKEFKLDCNGSLSCQNNAFDTTKVKLWDNILN